MYEVHALEELHRTEQLTEREEKNGVGWRRDGEGKKRSGGGKKEIRRGGGEEKMRGKK